MLRQRGQKNQQLIDQVEKAYASGSPITVTDYLTEARKDFDHAVDLMLTSGIDLKSDPQFTMSSSTSWMR